MAISLAVSFRRLWVALCFCVNEKRDDSVDGKGGIEVGPDYSKSLPENVLASIFLHCIALSMHSSSPFIEPHTNAAPLSMSQVSSSWRKIALKTPEMWSSFYARKNTHQEILQLWLARSGTISDLNLRIDGVHALADLQTDANGNVLQPFTRNPHLRTSTQVGRTLTFLASQIHRWRRVELALDVQTTCDFLDLPLETANRLKDLSITVIVRGEHDFPVRILDHLYMSTRSPSFGLQKLTWDCIPSERMVLCGIWGALREVHLNMGVTMDECIRFIKGCICAEKVTVACITNDCVDLMDHELQLEAAYRECTLIESDSLHSPQRNVLPFLRRLNIGMGGVVGDCVPIIQFFILPALVSLEMRSFDTSSRSCMLLGGFFKRSAGRANGQWNFDKLSIVDHHMSEKIVVQLLTAPGLAVERVPKISLYTRRSIQEYSILGLNNLKYFQDKWKGTGIERY